MDENAKAFVREAAEMDRAYAQMFKTMPEVAGYFSDEFLDKKIQDAEKTLKELEA